MNDDASKNTDRDDDKSAKEKSAKESGDRKFKTGVAVGIGSAAIVAALLYARSGKPKKKPGEFVSRTPGRTTPPDA